MSDSQIMKATLTKEAKQFSSFTTFELRELAAGLGVRIGQCGEKSAGM
jgi:hypothetical protein